MRNYCAQARASGAFLTGKTWNIPENAEKPERINKRKEQQRTLLDILREEKSSRYSGGIYHKTQIDHITYLDSYGREFYALEDGSYFLIENKTTTLFGAAYRIKDGSIEQICEKDKSICII